MEFVDDIDQRFNSNSIVISSAWVVVDKPLDESKNSALWVTFDG